jgi:hypothetical protein
MESRRCDEYNIHRRQVAALSRGAGADRHQFFCDIDDQSQHQPSRARSASCVCKSYVTTRIASYSEFLFLTDVLNITIGFRSLPSKHVLKYDFRNHHQCRQNRKVTNPSPKLCSIPLELRCISSKLHVLKTHPPQTSAPTSNQKAPSYPE